MAAVSTTFPLSYALFFGCFPAAMRAKRFGATRDIPCTGQPEAAGTNQSAHFRGVAGAVGYDSYKTCARAFKEVTGTNTCRLPKEQTIMP